MESRSSQTDNSEQLSAYEAYQQAIARVLNEGISSNPNLIEEMEIRFFHLVMKDDIDPAKALLNSGISVNAVDYNGRSALHFAADRGNQEFVQYLLNRSANPDQRDSRGETALSLAIKGKHADTAKILQKSSMASQSSPNHVYTESKTTRSMKASFAVMEAFPHSIAVAMLDGRKIEPINKSNVSLLFSDIVGFTALSSTMTAEKVSSMLNRLFKRFDRLAHLHGVQKIDVVGDAYIATTNFMEEQVCVHVTQVRKETNERLFNQPWYQLEKIAERRLYIFSLEVEYDLKPAIRKL